MIDTEQKGALLVKFLSEKFPGSEPAVNLKAGKFAIQVGGDAFDAFNVKDALARSAGVRVELLHGSRKEGVFVDDHHIVSGSLNQFTPEAIHALATHQKPLHIRYSAPAMQAGPDVITRPQALAIARLPGVSMNMLAAN